MKLFSFLNTINSLLDPANTKIHLAVWNGNESPLDVYLAGYFEEWQSWQSKRNFNRDYILSLVQLPEPNTWLFVGVYQSLCCEWNNDHYDYTTNALEAFEPYAGRLKVYFSRTGRQSYLLAENWCDHMSIKELMAEKLVVESFKGYQSTKLSKSHLDIVVREQVESWRTALSSVSGVYLITDLNNGKHYVGSATGDGGIWQRWCDYSYTGHGNNRQLCKLLSEYGIEYSNNFQYSILEIADTHKTKEEVLARESYWKDVLCSREFGYNEN
ncbi:TPA: GIY-YIG nuclease family protein [Vibrio vulnificus]|uniref:GIY-YIG nuclease family protein n=1 Tax=Vibrio parahaemolyticus TaxID=670 RepID=UPI00079616DE|nr:GIY-YIG nuclease family protein [Vibrio parahaemolyticus]KXJ49940.1 MAG: hypothetical protein AXW15_13135 [Neptuniibacter sp. Phe_28]MBY8092268.1 GIY-YIG nuclease family protein [Vibrio fluvialis]HDY8019681.1 GIY-YIG nuclease family protein [Vibrio vulnificus]EHR5465257.1 GIY-YIG nuclease family protein [Vibrio parahaemolyticus]EJG1645165.1 GIY-YIG nuclease family protein [Vibrio parahaemolyticus]